MMAMLYIVRGHRYHLGMCEISSGASAEVIKVLIDDGAEINAADKVRVA